ncbi:hypothetical protein C8J56DRAFT_970982 [Mycena floridula]|nr:hypothetical protein C8J56DRAFT_970982 [Mycena floridula]
MRLSILFGLIVSTAALPTTPPTTRDTSIQLMEFCTNINFHGSCAIAVPFDTQMPTPCADFQPPFANSLSSAKGISLGYTCFIFSGTGCQGNKKVISGTIPSFLDASFDFNDQALSWYCDGVPI